LTSPTIQADIAKLRHCLNPREAYVALRGEIPKPVKLGFSKQLTMGVPSVTGFGFGSQNDTTADTMP